MKRRRLSSLASATTAALLLLVVLLLSLSPRGASAAASGDVADLKCEDISRLPPTKDACDFAKRACDTGSLIPYTEIYYCLARPALGGPLAFVLVAVPSLALALVALFRALSATAEDYFTPSLTRAAAALRMPPRLAGATLLALGNGAPDIGAAVAAVSSSSSSRSEGDDSKGRGSGGVELAAGALLGSGLFVGCVVAGSVVRAAGGVPARGALVRDVCGYGFAVAGAVLVLSRVGKRGEDGSEATATAGAGSAAFLLLLYFVYVAAVAGADAAKIIKDARGFDEEVEGAVGNVSSSPLLGNGGGSSFWGLLPPEVDLPLSAAPLPTTTQQHHQQQRSPTSHLAGTRAANEELEMTFSDASTATTATGAGAIGQPRPTSPFSASARTTVSDWRASTPPLGGPFEGGGDEEEKEEEDKTLLLASATAASHDQFLHRAPPPPPIHPPASLFAESGSPPVAPDTVPRPLLPSQQQRHHHHRNRHLRRMRMGPLSFLFSAGDDENDELPPSSAPRSLSAKLSSALSVLDGPLALARAVTIPVLPGDRPEEEDDDDEGEGRQRRRDWLPLALLLGPLAATLRLCPYSASKRPVRFGLSLAAGAVAGAVASVACLICRSGSGGFGSTNDDEEQREQHYHQHHQNLLLLVPLPREMASRRIRKISKACVRTFSLLAAALWVDLLASELVGAVTFVGAVSGAPPALVGGTLLAWGNSAGDLATNVAVAKKGFANMALTACYASPLANLLLGLGVGIAVAVARGNPVRLPHSGGSGGVVGISGEIASAASWVAVMVLAVLAMALLNKRRLPPASSWVLLAVYLCFVAGGLASAASGG